MNYSVVPHSTDIPHNYNCKSLYMLFQLLHEYNNFVQGVFGEEKNRTNIYFCSVLFCDGVKLCLPQFDLNSEFEMVNRV